MSSVISFRGGTALIGPRPTGFDVSRSHTIKQGHPVVLLWTSDHLISKAATCTTQNKHNRRTSMPSAGFEPAIPAIKRLQTHALDHTATGIGVQ